MFAVKWLTRGSSSWISWLCQRLTADLQRPVLYVRSPEQLNPLINRCPQSKGPRTQHLAPHKFIRLHKHLRGQTQTTYFERLILSGKRSNLFFNTLLWFGMQTKYVVPSVFKMHVFSFQKHANDPGWNAELLNLFE